MARFNENEPCKLEATLTEKVRLYLKSLAPFGHFTKVSDRFHPGVSDFIGCYKGKFVAIELKSATGTPSIHQLEYIGNVIAAGGYGIVANTLVQVKQLIASIDAGKTI